MARSPPPWGPPGLSGRAELSVLASPPPRRGRGRVKAGSARSRVPFAPAPRPAPAARPPSRPAPRAPAAPVSSSAAGGRPARSHGNASPRAAGTPAAAVNRTFCRTLPLAFFGGWGEGGLTLSLLEAAERHSASPPPGAET